MPRKAAPSHIARLKITLSGSKPPIWRRVDVPATITLPTLHQVIQTVMGWQDYHLHQFTVGGRGGASYGVPDPDDFMEVRDERRVRLSQLLSTPKQKLVYEYDFGDSWEHIVLLEALLEPEPGVTYPRCVTGKRACPPEDCGGIWGYASFLEAIHDRQHPEHASMLEWVGGEFDPEAFDIVQVNARLRALA